MPFDPSDAVRRARSLFGRRAEMPLGRSVGDGDGEPAPVTGRRRDTVRALAASSSDPAVVSVSDVHGYLDAARSALLAPADHPAHDPVVVAGDDGRLHWAGNDYVLVFNGDLIDRGPDNAGTLRTVARLLEEAPPGRVRVTLGNHEMGVLTPDLFGWGDWYSVRVGEAGRRSFCRAVRAGHVVAAYEGYNVTYAHAGLADEYDAAAVTDRLVAATQRLADAVGTDGDAAVQEAVVSDYPRVLGMGSPHPKQVGAGLVWLDFRHLPPDAPPQVVGHTRHDAVTRTGRVVCQNVIRETRGSPGGEAVLVETPDSLVVLRREPDGSVAERPLDHPDVPVESVDGA